MTPFIPSRLDDYGLSLAEFRLVCHVARRGICHEAIPNMARVCRMDVKTMKRCIKATVRLNILHRQFRKGETLILKLRPMEEWMPSPKDTLGVKRPDTSPISHPNHQAQTTPHKGNPIEGNPIRGEQSLARERELWQLLNDEKTLKERLQTERDYVKPDKAMLESLRGQLRLVKDEIRNLPSVLR
jgi:hypothetical protein